MFWLNIIWQIGPTTVIIYLHTSTYAIFFAGVWEGGVSFSNTAQFATLLRNKGASTEVSRKQMEHCLTNVSVNRMCRSITIF